MSWFKIDASLNLLHLVSKNVQFGWKQSKNKFDFIKGEKVQSKRIYENTF